MPSVTITLTDTPTGGVAVYSNYAPALGSKTTPAQQAAQDIVNRTCREYGLKPVRQVGPLVHGGDIDAAHRGHDNAVEPLSFPRLDG